MHDSTAKSLLDNLNNELNLKVVSTNPLIEIGDE